MQTKEVLTDDELLALLVAMDKQISPQVEEAKRKAREGLLEAFHESGIEKRAVMVNGEKVGDVGVRWSKARAELDPHQEAAAMDFLREHDLTEERPVQGWQSSFAVVDGRTHYITEEGEIGDCVDFVQWTPERVQTASVTGLEPERVFTPIREKLGADGVLALLEGGLG